jgi:ACS family hexuronate transporter-like MFS transporter
MDFKANTDLKMLAWSLQSSAFFVTYSSMFARYAIIGTWAVSKPYIQKDLGFTESDFGSFEFLFLLAYAVGNYVSGVLIDKWSARLVVSVGLALTACLMSTVRAP